MNKIYKIIWSKARNCYVVVSELAKRNGKCKNAFHGLAAYSQVNGKACFAGLSRAICAVLLAGLVSYPGSVAWGASGTMVTGVQTSTRVVNGVIVVTSVTPIRLGSASGSNSVAAGDGSSASADKTVALGFYAQASGSEATAVGAGAKAYAFGASAFGRNTVVRGERGVAIGYGATALGKSAVAFGRRSVSSGTGSFAFQGGTALTYNATAFGTATQAGSDDGSDSSIVEIESYQGREVAGFKTVSYGGKEYYRLTFPDGHTEDKTMEQIEQSAVFSTGLRGVNSLAFGNSTKATNTDATAFGYQTTASGEEATAFGYKAKATGIASTAFGWETEAADSRSTAFGISTVASGKNSTAFGYSTTASGENATAFGSGTQAVGGGATAWGTDTEARAETSTAWGNGSIVYGGTWKDASRNVTYNDVEVLRDSDKPEGKQYFIEGVNAATGEKEIIKEGIATRAEADDMIRDNGHLAGYNSTAFGMKSVVYSENALAALGGVVGELEDNKGRNSAAIGKGAWVSEDNAFAFGAGAKATEADSVALGSGSAANTPAATVSGYDLYTGQPSVKDDAVWRSTMAAVSVGDAANGITRQITGVAAGSADTDAVNVAQLKRAASINIDDRNMAISQNNDGEMLFNSPYIHVEGVGEASKARSIIEYGSKEDYRKELQTESDNLQIRINSFTKSIDDLEKDIAILEKKRDADGTGEYPVPNDTVKAGYQALIEEAEGEKEELQSRLDKATADKKNVDDSLSTCDKDFDDAEKLIEKQAYAYGEDSMTLGKGSVVGEKDYTAAGKESIAIGVGNKVTGNNSVAIGSRNGTADAPVATDNTFILGSDVAETLADSVFLGRGAGYVAAGDSTAGNTVYGTRENTLTINGTKYEFAGADPTGVVSVGGIQVDGTQATRRIQNVAAGLVSKDSTDAINGSQLYSALDSAQFSIVGGDNVEVIKNTDDNGHAVYTIHSLNAIVTEGTNITVTPTTPETTTKTNGQTTDLTAGETGTTAGTGATDGTAAVTAGTTPAPAVSDDPIKPSDTNNHTTTYKIDASTYTLSGDGGVDDGKGNTTYTVTLTDSEDKPAGTAIIVDTNTDTQYDLSGTKGEKAADGSTTYTISLKDKAGNEAGTAEVVDTDTDTQYVLTGEKAETENGAKYTISLKDLVGNNAGTAEIVDTRNTVEAGDDTIEVEPTKNADGSLKYTIKSKVKAVSNVEVKAGSDNVTVASEDVDDKKIYTVDVKANGKVASGDTGIVTGDTVYNETRVQNDGNYIKKDNTAAENITALDNQVNNNAQNIENLGSQINNTYNQINNLDNRMRKGLAGAAALAALHPMDFNPDDKLQFAAGVGNYRGETAAALGAFYRPDESVMFSIGGTFGNADNMVNAGITFGLDGTRNRITRSRTAMAREIQDLRSLVTQMAARMDRMEAANGIETAMFPDVPENHWAYEYVEDLQKRGALKGYPDGLFKGDRAMTRYEFAAMLDRIVRSGVTLDPQIAKEFEPELGRIYVERISGQDNDRKKIERVRVNNSDSKYPEGKTRDVYGSKIVTETPGQAAEK